MLHLHILRHASTSWALPGQLDFERKLNQEGIEDLPVIASWFEKHKIIPGHVYCSPADRTKATLSGIIDAISETPSVDYVDAFYNGYLDEYLETVQFHEKSQDILLVGHNPTCASLLAMLISPDDAESSKRVSYSFPAGALASLSFDIENWQALKPNSGKLVDFLIPRPSQRYGS